MSAFLTKPSIGKAFTNEIRAISNKNRHLIDDELLEELKEAFTLFDTNHSGGIDLRELKAAIRALGHEVTKPECIQLFRDVDKDPATSINYEEFCKIMSTRIREKDTRNEIQKVFEMFDVDSQKKISFKNLKRIAQEVGEEITDQELHDMIAEADKTGDGMITMEEFYRVMKKSCNDPMNEFDSDNDKD